MPLLIASQSEEFHLGTQLKFRHSKETKVGETDLPPRGSRHSPMWQCSVHPPIPSASPLGGWGQFSKQTSSWVWHLTSLEGLPHLL